MLGRRCDIGHFSQHDVPPGSGKSKNDGGMEEEKKKQPPHLPVLFLREAKPPSSSGRIRGLLKLASDALQILAEGEGAGMNDLDRDS